jgi:hypothetical protein
MTVALLALTLASMTARPAAAQAPHPRADLFAGYSLLAADGDDFPRQTSHGFQVSATANLTRWFGVVGDFGMQFNTARDLGPNFVGLEARSTVREYLIGPRFTMRSESADVFAHGLFGIATGDAGPGFEGFSDSGVAFGGGGGVDVHVDPRMSIRVQFDLLASFADIVEANPRFAAGVVWRLGRR